ncbi:hypothetical protein F5Y10DRAFT_291449 [Nemania abortiva]|nr:hypothetical protein F5Y10DRAFT_291449 [Nemania abortiva]
MAMNTNAVLPSPTLHGGSDVQHQYYSTLEPDYVSTLERHYDPQKQAAEYYPRFLDETRSDGLQVVDQPVTHFEPNTAVSKRKTICGIGVRTFWIGLVAAIVVVAGAVAGGVAGGITSHKPENPTAVTSAGNGTGNGTTIPEDPGAVMTRTRLASTNFADEFGNSNYLVLYQLNSKAIYMSAFNSSAGDWTVSPVVDGTAGSIGGALDDVLAGTALGIDVFVHSASSRDIHIYWQSVSGTVRSVQYLSFLSTNTAVSVGQWVQEYDAADYKVAGSGASIVSYAHGCDDCAAWTYYFCQLPTQRVTGAFRTPTADNGQPGWVSVDFVNGITLPALNTSIGLAPIRVLNQVVFDGEAAFYDTVLDMSFKSVAEIVAFSVGSNDTGVDDPLQFHVLSVEVSGPVYLSYYKDGSWATQIEVSTLSDCSSKATLAVNQGQRVYCVIDDGNGGVEIVEWMWQADPYGNAAEYINYERVGTIRTS